MTTKTTKTNRYLPTDKWWYLLDTDVVFDRPGSAGYVISRHRSQDAAFRADAALQRAVRKANGWRSYVKTRVVHGIGLSIDPEIGPKGLAYYR